MDGGGEAWRQVSRLVFGDQLPEQGAQRDPVGRYRIPSQPRPAGRIEQRRGFEAD
jgi:hypothetical protein